MLAEHWQIKKEYRTKWKSALFSCIPRIPRFWIPSCHSFSKAITVRDEVKRWLVNSTRFEKDKVEGEYDKVLQKPWTCRKDNQKCTCFCYWGLRKNSTSKFLRQPLVKRKSRNTWFKKDTHCYGLLPDWKCNSNLWKRLINMVLRQQPLT